MYWKSIWRGSLHIFWLWAGLFEFLLCTCLFAFLHLRVRPGLRPFHRQFRFMKIGKKNENDMLQLCCQCEYFVLVERNVSITFFEICWLHVWENMMLDLNLHIEFHATHTFHPYYKIHRFFEFSTFVTYLATKKMTSFNISYIIKDISIIDMLSTIPCTMHVPNLMLSLRMSASCQQYKPFSLSHRYARNISPSQYRGKWNQS